MFVTTSVFDDLSFLCDCLLRGCRLTCTRAFVRLDDEDDVFCAATTKPLLRRAFSLANITFSRQRILRVFCVCVCVYKAKRRSVFCASFKTYSDCSDDRLSFSLSLSLRFNLNAQICNGYNGKRGFCWCKKKREKRTTLLCEKETRLQLESLKSKRFLSLSSFSLSLSLSLFHSLCYFIRLNRESTMCSGS